MASVDVLGTVCHVWDHKAHACAESIDVLTVAGSGAAHYVSKLQTDADGSPWAYHPSDKKPPDNNTKAFDWLANSADLHGIQGQNGAVGPAAGFYISGTSLSDPAYHENDTRHWVDAGTIPYIVLPSGAFPVPAGMSLHKACVAFVVDLNSGGSSGAIYADSGRAVGEGSIALALRLGLKPFSKRYPPKVVGFDRRDFLHVVFPMTTVAAPWPVATIQSMADRLFEGWGGETQSRALYPKVPPLKRPSESVGSAAAEV